MLQAANASPKEVQKLEKEIQSLKQAQETHKDEAQRSHSYYAEVTNKCAAEYDKITSLDKKTSFTRSEKAKLTRLKKKFTLVICVDYQMGKLVPYWGLNPQPGCTYYLQKLNHDIFGTVNHGSKESTVYIFDERVGPKNTDHTISYLTDYIKKLPNWVWRIHIFLDNTASTNKNFFMMG